MEDISIHAPARGATGFFWIWVRALEISIHAPARGATGFHSPLNQAAAISIHAPARGATLLTRTYVRYIVFLSTLPQGERLRQSISEALRSLFLSTLPQGERRIITAKVARYLIDFYPRSRKGSDRPGPSAYHTMAYFYPRSRKGSDLQGLPE